MMFDRWLSKSGQKLLRFTFVGGLAFLIDSSALYLGLALGLNLFTGRLFSFFVAASIAWLCHRRITFRLNTPPRFTEWLRFIAANAIGGVINLAIYSVLILSAELFRDYPPIAIGIAALFAMIFNFAASARMVFKTQDRSDRAKSSFPPA